MRRCTWRRFNDVIWSGLDLTTGNTVYPLVGVTRADYVAEGVVEGNVQESALIVRRSTRRHPRACRLATAAEYRNRPGLSSAVHRFRSAGHQTAVQPLDGALRLFDQCHREHFDDPSAAVQDPDAVHDVAEH